MNRKISGDTIVEVMIALAIISTVITLSYTTASRALILGRRAQERSEALKLAESTVERIKSYAITDPVAFYDMKTHEFASYCLEPNGTSLNLFEQKVITQEVRDDQLKISANGEPLSDDTYHSNCGVGIDKRYKMSITRMRINDDQNEYTVRARWESLGGGQDEVKLVYKYHRSSTIPELIPPSGECPSGFRLAERIIDPSEIDGGLVDVGPLATPIVNVGQTPDPAALGTNNVAFKEYRFASGGSFYSQTVFRGNNRYPSDGDFRNALSFINGRLDSVPGFPFILQDYFPGHDIDGLPGTSEVDIPEARTWFYTNGNSISALQNRGALGPPTEEEREYVLYGRRLSNIEAGTYVFYAYMTNVIEPPHDAFDPIIAIKVGGEPWEPSGTLLRGQQLLQLKEVDTQNSRFEGSTRAGWVRVAGVFTVPDEGGNRGSVVFKFTDRALNTNGDDFGMTSFGVTRCRPN